MRAERIILVVVLSVVCWACEVNYSFGEKDFNPRVAINALISPQEPFEVREPQLFAPKRFYTR